MYRVVDTPFNQANYADLIGTKHVDPPAYVHVEEIEEPTEEEIVISDNDYEILCGLRPPRLVDPTGVGPTIVV
jgi:hypothetical protein